MSSVLRVSNLSKKYRVRSLSERGFRRDSVVEAIRQPIRDFRSWMRGEIPEDDTFWALKDVDFEVHAGEVLGLVGKNGAGKSTLLKILSRITEPTTGRVEIDGRVASLLEVGTGFHPELSGRENIYLNGTILGMTKKEIDKKFDEIVDFSEVERFIETPVKRYSSGMIVRLAFAVAAHLEPEILFIDEVLAVGDAEFQSKCLGKMDDVAHEGRTVLFVSHNMAAVQRLCSRGILLRDGRIQSGGDIGRVVSEYMAGEERPRFESGELTGTPQVLLADIRNEAGEPVAKPLCTEPFDIDLNYLVPHPAPGLIAEIRVLTAAGTVVFSTTASDDDMKLPSSPDRYHARVRIPADTLLAGEYHVGIFLGTDHETFDLHEPAMTFSLAPGPSAVYLRRHHRRGFVQVPCRWRVTAVGDGVGKQVDVNHSFSP